MSPSDDKRSETSLHISSDALNAGAALSSSEFVTRFGDGNAEYVKGFAGIDNETGQVFAKSLKGISQGKLNPQYRNENLKQQSGYAAEVAATSRDNAEARISGSYERTTRSDDLPQYGKNHNVVDRVKVLNGEVIDGSQTQMKFVGDRDDLFRKITKEDGEFARYRGVKLELPSEQFEGAKTFCLRKAQALRGQALKAEQKGASPEAVSKLRRRAENYDQLAEKVADAGLTSEDALFYRNHPKVATAFDITRTSHRAGLEGAKTGAVIGAVISLMQNAFAVAQEKKTLLEATKDVAAGTAKAGAVGYGSAFVGSAIKGVMQQSASNSVRQLAKTSAPTLALSICMSLGCSITSYVRGEISEAELLADVGEKGSGLLSSGMMAALGQIVIPVPFVGAAIGGMIGYTLSSLFYQAALNAGQQADAAQVRLIDVKAIEVDARERIARERAELNDFVRRELPDLQHETWQFFAGVDVCQGERTFVDAINQYAELLGAKLEFSSLAEFDSFMEGDQALTL